jgi:hypothetical protein
MDKSRTNIDLVFRNGLKDLEVLPPPGVWEGISPVIAKKASPFIWLRVAAIGLLLLTSGFFIYQYTRNTTNVYENKILAFNVANSPVFYKNQNAEAVTYFDTKGISLAQNLNFSTSVKKEETTTVLPDNGLISEYRVVPLKNGLNLRKVQPLAQSFSPVKVASEIKSISVQPADYIALSDYTAPKTPERWSIAAMASPTYYSNFNSGAASDATHMAASEQPVVSYSGGLALSFKISKRLSVQSGLYYSSLGQEVDGINSFAGFQSYVYSKGDHNFEVLTTTGTIFINNKDVFLTSGGNDQRIITAYNNDIFDPKKASLNYLNNSIQQNFSYLELPVILKYKIVDKAIDLNMTGGLSYNMLVGNSVYTVVDGTKYAFGETKGLNTFMVSSSVGMGMEYSFSDKLSINLEPTFRYYLNPFTGSSSSAVHPYSFGIFSGLSYKF